MSRTAAAFDEKFDKLEKKIDKISEVLIGFTSKIDEINGRLNNIETSLDHQVKEINGKVTLLEENIQRNIVSIQHIESRVDRIERQALLCDVVVHGIPAVKNENLFEIFTKICNITGFKFTFKPAIYRAKNKRNANTTANKSVVIIKLASILEKNAFLNSFRSIVSKEPLKLSKIGLVGDTTILLNESLTHRNRKILQMALKCKKINTALLSVYTLDGIVNVVVNNGDKFISTKIFDCDQLVKFDIQQPSI